MKIEILGSGCPSCKKLEANAIEAVGQKGIDAEVVKVSDMAKIMEYGLTSTPGLVVDGEVKSTGKLLTSDQIASLL